METLLPCMVDITLFNRRLFIFMKSIFRYFGPENFYSRMSFCFCSKGDVIIDNSTNKRARITIKGTLDNAMKLKTCTRNLTIRKKEQTINLMNE
jgi:hypothetical protein